MGLFRKMASVSTCGAVDMRSDKERIARKTAKGARAAKVSAREAQAQTRLMQAQHELSVRQARPLPRPVARPLGPARAGQDVPRSCSR